MSRRQLGALIIVVFSLAVLFAGYVWWKVWSAPLVSVIMKPAFSIHGISTGTYVRIQGVKVGQVASIGLEADSQGLLRPVVKLSLDPAHMQSPSFADRFRGMKLRDEVAHGLCAQLTSVNPTSGLLEVELLWDFSSLPHATNLGPDEVPARASKLQSAINGIAEDAEQLALIDFLKIRSQFEKSLDRWLLATDPASVSSLAAEIVRRTEALCLATDPTVLGASLSKLAESASRLRSSVEQVNRQFDDASILLLQTQISEATAAFISFGATLDNSNRSIKRSADELSVILRSISEGARNWKKRIADLSPNPVAR